MTAMEKNPTLKHIQKIAFMVILAGGVISISLVIHAGSQNDSILLKLLFAGWVISPFIALVVADLISAKWPFPILLFLYILVVVLIAGSLLAYSRILFPAGTRPAFVFLIVPLISWLLIGVFVILTFIRSQKDR